MQDKVWLNLAIDLGPKGLERHPFRSFSLRQAQRYAKLYVYFRCDIESLLLGGIGAIFFAGLCPAITKSEISVK